ncbi:MAG: ABC transporter ATP-binding protein/permease [Planctomycetaceae bacterium]|jgi:ATP-binding cassette subfamily B protein/subfamily B ATP-binding cassette protein MsbA|nr:ABC transporter ATP-binding protein/permease [Planctomycetaceae bacterium]
MSNFWRAVYKTFQYRFLIIFTVVCALMIGLLWGGNIGALAYPITEICLKKGTFTTWLNDKIEQNQIKINELNSSIQKTENQNTNNNNLTFRLNTLKYSQDFYLGLLPIVQKYTPTTPFGTVLFLIVIVLIGTIAKIFFIVFHGITSARIAQLSAMEIRKELFNKMISHDINYFNQSGIADTMSRFTNDLTILTTGLNVIYGKILREPIKMIVCLAIAAYISWQLLIITILLVPLAALAIRWLARSIKRVVRRSMEEIALLYGKLEETFHSIKIIQVFIQESTELEKFNQTNRACCDKAIKIAKYESLVSPMTELFGILMISMGIIVGTYLLMGEQTTLLGISMITAPMDTGSLIMFFALLAGAADPARRLSDIFTQFQAAAAAADRIYATIDQMPKITDPINPKILPTHKKSIQFENINFAYESDRPILKGVSFNINFGECIVIIGKSGCGKSTLLNLIPRFADPTSGEILIDGIPINQVQLRNLREQIGLVTQDPILFNDTVLNNIRYSLPNATTEDAINAAKKANAHDFIINELSDGYNTFIGAGGGQLSGGQRQRIALARAILRDPPIFLLDEATSQIDIQSERMIHNALKDFKRDRTTIIITHRLSAIELSDKVIIMDDGQITASGTHQYLLQNNTTYAKLYEH